MIFVSTGNHTPDKHQLIFHTVIMYTGIWFYFSRIIQIGWQFFAPCCILRQDDSWCGKLQNVSRCDSCYNWFLHSVLNFIKSFGKYAKENKLWWWFLNNLSRMYHKFRSGTSLQHYNHPLSQGTLETSTVSAFTIQKNCLS